MLQFKGYRPKYDCYIIRSFGRLFLRNKGKFWLFSRHPVYRYTVLGAAQYCLDRIAPISCLGRAEYVIIIFGICSGARVSDAETKSYTVYTGIRANTGVRDSFFAKFREIMHYAYLFFNGIPV